MAITAEFLADFSSFVRGSADATTALKTVERSSQDVAESSSSMLGGMKGMALDLAGAFGIAFSIGAVVSFTKELIAAASALETMHAKTGISVEELQRMGIVGDGVGVSLDTMTSAATRLQASLGKGDKGVAAALTDLGINLETFKGLGAADQMAQIAEAVRGMEDPLRVAADLQAVYGKGWADLFPALKAGFQGAGDDVTVMSSRTVTALDSAGNAMGEFWRATKANLGEALADILTLSTSEWRGLKSEIDHATDAAVKMKAAGLTPVKDGLVDVSGAAALLNDGLDEQKRKIDADIVGYKNWAEAETQAMTAALKHQQDLRKAENQHGVALLKESAEGYDQLKKVQDAYADSVMKSSMDTTTYQITKIWEKADAEIAAFKGTEEQAKTHADLVYSLAEQEAKGITDVMKGAIDEMVSMASSGLDATVAKAQAAVNQTYTMAGGGYKPTAAQYDEYYKTAAGIEDIIRNKGKRYYEGEAMPRAGGGPVSAGSPYLVGERGPELFVPSRSGSIVPNGGTTVINITQPLGDPAAIARAVEDAMNRSLRTSGVRLPAGA